MRLSTKSCLGLALVVASCGSPARIQELTISDAWARPTPSGSTMGAVYMRITSPINDELIGASTSIAAIATVHASTASDSGDRPSGGHGDHGGGSAEVKMSDNAVVLMENSTVNLEPGGLHVMLEGLEQALTEGESFELQLTFRNARERNVVVRVSANPPTE